MKSERVLIAAILVTGVVALFAAAASAKGGSSGAPPAGWHPELTGDERAFVWGELQSRTGSEILHDSDNYAHTVLRGGPLSPMALTALMAEAALKAGAGK